MKISTRFFNPRAGAAALYATILILAVVFSIAMSASFLVYSQQKISQDSLKSSQAYFAAESGIEDAVLRVTKGMPVSGNYQLIVGNDSAQVTITGDEVKTIDSLAEVRGANKKIRTVLSIEAVSPQFYYGVQIGEGGMEMSANSQVIGNIYSDGTIDGSSGNLITGDVTVATGNSPGENSLVQNQDQIFGRTSPVLDLAQQFSPNSGTDGPLAQASFYLRKVGNPGNLTVRILTDSVDTPTQTVLASASLVASSVGSSYSWVSVAFSSPPTLIAGNKYWLMIDTSANSNNYWVWGMDSNQGYGNGIAKYSANWNAGSPVWSAPLAGDLDFRTFMGGPVTGIHMVNVQGTSRANTITGSQICGDAYYQSIDATSLSFLNNPTSSYCPLPLTPGTAYPDSNDPPIVPMPISQGNINDWEEAAEAGGVFNSGSPQCAPTSDMVIGPARLNCDWSVSNNIVITIKGPVWVNGDIDLSNNVALVLDPSFGDTLSSVVIADAKEPPNQATKGRIITQNNVAICGTEGYNEGTNSCNARAPENKSYIMMLSTYSGTSRAINIQNNVEGAIFYASQGSVGVENNVQVKEITAYKIELENNATIIYESGLFDAKFSSGPGGSWEVVSWKEVE